MKKKEDYTCPICGSVENDSRWENPQRIDGVPHCFSCVFWTGKAQDYARGERIAINGNCWTLRFRQGVPKELRGCAGTTQRVRMLADGSEIESSDVWHQGKIPDHFRHLMPDNAVFVPTDQDRVHAAYFGIEVPDTIH